MNILVTGASGFLGSQLVTDLLKQGHQVTCCVRNVEYTKKLFSNAKIIYCDFTKDTSVSDWLLRLKDIDIVINTVGIFYHPNKKIIWKIHFDTPRALFDACVQTNVKRIIQISALGVDKYEVDYGKSKLAADNYLLSLNIPSIIIRPSLIYGRGSYGGTSLFRGLSGMPFIIPVPGKGNQELQPIHLQDLSKCILHLIKQPLTQSIILNAGSEKRIKLKDILTTIRQWLAFPKAIVMHIPNFFIAAGSFVGNAFPNSTINKSGYKMLMQNNTISTGETDKFIQAIGFKPVTFEEGLFSQPSTVQDRWHARLYFVKPLLQISLAFLWILTAICSLWIFPRSESYQLLHQVGINYSWQPFFLYSAAILDLLIGLALLLNYQVRKICILQLILILSYTLIITFKLPGFWFHPFGPIVKNIPILVSIYILYVLQDSR